MHAASPSLHNHVLKGRGALVRLNVSAVSVRCDCWGRRRWHDCPTARLPITSRVICIEGSTGTHDMHPWIRLRSGRYCHSAHESSILPCHVPGEYHVDRINLPPGCAARPQVYPKPLGASPISNAPKTAGRRAVEQSGMPEMTPRLSISGSRSHAQSIDRTDFAMRRSLARPESC